MALSSPSLPPAAIAQLGGYDADWLRDANDALWSGIARRLTALGAGAVPAALDRVMDMEEAWLAPGLLIAQTCGYPLMTRLRGRVRLVSTPRYATPFGEGGLYRSAIVVRAGTSWSRLDDLRGRRAAINAWTSNSGMNLLRAAVAPLARDGRFFAGVRVTGAHLASLAAVAAGEADVAAVDGVTLALTARHRPDLLRDVRVLGTTPRSPMLPLVTRADATDGEVDALRAALDAAMDDPSSRDARDTLGLLGFDHGGLERFDSILVLEREAAALGYPVLA